MPFAQASCCQFQLSWRTHIAHIYNNTSGLWTINTLVIAVTYDYCSLLTADSSFIWSIQK